jgi:hypothetical protein
MPAGAVQRVFLALAVAAALVYGLMLALDLGLAPERAGPPRVTVDSPAPYRLPGLVPEGWCHVLYVVGPGADLPAGLAPVVGLDGGGGVQLLRAPPPPSGPEFEPWLAAGVRLPATHLGELGPETRAALLAMFRAWQGRLGRTARWRAVAVGVEDPLELEILARWER